MVINDVFDDNMLIVKSEGSQTIIRYDETITVEEMHKAIEKQNINIDDCKVVVVDNDWKGNTKLAVF